MGWSEVLEFWFGELDAQGFASDEVVQRWFRASDEFDADIRARFGALRSRVSRGMHDDWLDDPLGTVAYVVVLDQFSRNLGRGTAAMYECDDLALRAAKRALDAGIDAALAYQHRTTLFMPFMHSEELADQDRCVALFEAIAAEYPGRGDGGVKYARMHRDIVAKWGRFPHRNEILGRESTPEEIEFLTRPGSSF